MAFLDCIICIEGMLALANCDSYILCGDFNSSFQRANAQSNCLQQFLDRNNLMSSWEHVLAEQNFTYVNHSLGHRSCIDHFFTSRNIYDFILESNILFHALNPSNDNVTNLKNKIFARSTEKAKHIPKCAWNKAIDKHLDDRIMLNNRITDVILTLQGIY